MSKLKLNLDFDHLNTLFEAIPQDRRINLKSDPEGNLPTSLNTQQLYNWAKEVWSTQNYTQYRFPLKGCGFRWLQPVIALANNYQIVIPDVPVFYLTGILLSQKSGESPFILSNPTTIVRYSEKSRPQDSIFLSHSSVDNDFTAHIDLYLSSFSETFFDQRDLKPGHLLDRVLYWSLKKSNYLVLILSPDSVSSWWVEREWKWWIANKGPSGIIPVMFQRSQVPEDLQDIKYISYQGDLASVASQIAHGTGEIIMDEFD